ncbi:MAG: Lrp/AsnC family transcriptional regulator [Mycobacteriales bacterium]
MVLEDSDRAIVRHLSGAARLSFTELAKRTGLSVSTVHQRVRRLEERGVLTGYRASVDAQEVGLPLTAFVSLTPIDPSAPDDTPARLANLAAIEACHSVAGAESYILKVRVPGPVELESLLADIRTASGMATRTTVVLSTPWEDRPPQV